MKIFMAKIFSHLISISFPLKKTVLQTPCGDSALSIAAALCLLLRDGVSEKLEVPDRGSAQRRRAPWAFLRWLLPAALERLQLQLCCAVSSAIVWSRYSE